jgi:glycosyltransferase involved in cell wall biosynthesis
MKIALINNLYAPYQRGGAERIVELLNDGLRAAGQETLIISTRPQQPADQKLSREKTEVSYLASSYFELNQLSQAARLFWQLNNLWDTPHYRAVKKLLEKFRPELTITNNLMGLGLKVPQAIKDSGSRQIHILHDIQLLHPSGLMYYGQEKILSSAAARLYQAATRAAFKRAGKDLVVVSPSAWLLRLHQERGFFENNRTAVIPNPLLAPTEPLTASERQGFLFIGQLEQHKGLDLFVQAAARFPEQAFTVIGDGPLRHLASGTNVKFLGQQDHETINRLLSKSLAVIIPSRCYENSPTVIYEAAAANTPTIAADLGGIPELIDRFGGLLFSPDDLDSLVMTIQEFLDHGTVLKAPPPADYAAEILRLYN